MLKDITIGQYYNADSPIHRLDPRVKILSAIAYMIALFLVGSILGYLPTALALVALVRASHVPYRLVAKGLKPIVFLVFFAFVLNVFLTPGEGAPLVQIGFLRIYALGLERAFIMAIRLILLIMGTSLLTLTTSPIELTDGIESLLKPFRVIGLPAHEIAMMMTIALRFIPTLLEETDKIMKAQMARGADFESGNLTKRAKALIPLLVPLFISAFRRADELAMAMEARCYRGGEGRTRMKILRYMRADYAAMFLVALYVASCVYL